VSSDVDTGLAFAEGASAILTKPIGEHEFRIAVKDLLITKGWRVLIVDSNTDFRILLKHELEQKGIHVDDLDHGNLVFGRIHQEYYDLILVDMDLPDVSGSELIKAIRRQSEFEKQTVFLIAEDYNRISGRADLASLGINRFLGKQEGISGVTQSIVHYLEEKNQIDSDN
jgi:CheY-like chemotaxis protein